MHEETLAKIGMTQNESKVYLALLKLGMTPAQPLVRESGLHRSRVYEVLEKLQAKGLASHVVKNFKKYFQAVAPDKLLSYLDEQREAVSKILPALQNMQGIKREEIQAHIYSGKEGVKSIHAEMLKEGKDIYVFGAKGLIFSEMQYFIPNFERERLRKGMKFISLWDNKEVKEKLYKNRTRELSNGKILPNGFSSKSGVNIFGDKVAIFLWNEKKHPSGFLIDNKDVADTFRKWFNLVYGMLPEGGE
ncbi:TPA: hypothetical protein HA361_00160 [Candidatus Woesearchaeota archaeon]|nr:hypothetical protein [Candidatus Woesearchaeota archaeon]HII69038.1 hypothetical protein [Candidatus Woesearchaeota archaeon]